MIDQPSPNGDNGRGHGGRFSKGNAGGPGNPFAKRVGKLRTVLLRCVSPVKLRACVDALLREAQAGNVQAIREVLDRTLGRPVEADLIARLEQLEAIQTGASR